MKAQKVRSRLFEEVIVKSWWVILFFTVCFFLFDLSLKRKNTEEGLLRKKLLVLTEEKEEAEKKFEELKLEIASQSDPAWIEMTLMRCLGMVPEGDTKIHFTSKSK
jgi:hypothetical protein